MIGRSQKIFRLLLVLMSAVIIFCSFYNLSNFPTVWWDEAIFSETAANLVQHGRYAFTIQSPDILKDFDFRISAGPVVILPVALAYRLFGVSVWSGRMVAGAFLVLAFAFLYLSARLLLSPGPALLAVLLSLFSTGILYWGRSVMGDVPALACFLAGIFSLIKGLQERRYVFFFAAGLCLGLAVAAKEFYGFTILPAMAALVWEYRRRRPELLKAAGALLAGAALPLAAYVVLKAVVLGGVWPGPESFLLPEETVVPRILHSLHHRPDLSRKRRFSVNPSPVCQRHHRVVALPAAAGEIAALALLAGQFVLVEHFLCAGGLLGTVRAAGAGLGESLGSLFSGGHL